MQLPIRSARRRVRSAGFAAAAGSPAMQTWYGPRSAPRMQRRSVTTSSDSVARAGSRAEVARMGRQAGGRAHALADRGDPELPAGEADRQEAAAGIDGGVGHVAVGHDRAERTAEPEIDDGEPARGIVDDGEAAMRREPDPARGQADGLEDAPAGE